METNPQSWVSNCTACRNDNWSEQRLAQRYERVTHDHNVSSPSYRKYSSHTENCNLRILPVLRADNLY